MYLDLLKTMQSQGAYFASLAHIDAFRQQFGETPDLRVLQADALRETGEMDSAAQIYRSLAKTPHAAAALHGLGLIAARRGDIQQAQRAFEQAVRLEPLNVRYLGDLGYAQLSDGLYPQARAALAKAAELAPGNPRAVSNLALWALLSGQPAMAESMIQRAALSAANRDEIHKLARQLQAQRNAAATSTSTLPTAESAVPVSAALAHEPAPVITAARPTPPGSMLERFNAPTSPHNEATTP